MKKRNVLKENDCQPLTTITFAHENDSAQRTIITCKAHGNDDARRITITYKKRRGRPPLVLPSEDVLTPYLREALCSPSLSPNKLRAYEILWKDCGYSFTALKRFLAQYLPNAVKDEKTLKKYVTLSKAMQEAIQMVKSMNPNTKELITKEELELLIYTYLKQKLKKCIREANEDFVGFSWNNTSGEKHEI